MKIPRTSRRARSAIALVAGFAAALAAAPALAEGSHRHGDDRGSSHERSARGAYTDWARVLDVEPIRRTVRVSTPRRECWEEAVTRYRRVEYDDGPGGYRDPGYRSYTPLLLGSLIGGVIGNQFGKGDGNSVLTAAGAVIGGSVGRDIEHHHRRYAGRAVRVEREPYETYETRCETRDEYHEEERTEGYRVRYEYNGRVYTTRTARDPGDRMRVRVEVRPQG